MHEPGERRYSLALDLAEIFKPLLVDRVIFKVLNRREITVSDFNEKAKKILLKEKGGKAFVKAFDDRLGETFKHRKLGRNVSYKYLIIFKSRQEEWLEKEVVGNEKNVLSTILYLSFL